MSPPTLFTASADDRDLEDRFGHEVPNVVVVDPQFGDYKALAESARAGKLNLHFRSSGADALKLARRLEIDAWLVAEELDDMSGRDFLHLLQARLDGAQVALVSKSVSGNSDLEPTEQLAPEAGVTATLTPPITMSDLERLLGLPVEDRAVILPAEQSTVARTLATLPIGVSAAAVAVAVLMIR